MGGECESVDGFFSIRVCTNRWKLFSIHSVAHLQIFQIIYNFASRTKIENAKWEEIGALFEMEIDRGETSFLVKFDRYCFTFFFPIVANISKSNILFKYFKYFDRIAALYSIIKSFALFPRLPYDRILLISNFSRNLHLIFLL